eukprot:TRINITY_DN25461_c0_g1_i1.p1 TRINITY_DN25461_c0_g1~~TRINITY_DN25461_c0_g1_i1.p1  ORF type:complete len:614 (-),score=79.91 TRINITY_DN25461_c0_g1_i1:517-2358(-)
MSLTPKGATPSENLSNFLNSVQCFVEDYSRLQAENAQLRSRLDGLVEDQRKDEGSWMNASTTLRKEEAPCLDASSSHAQSRVVREFPSLLQTSRHSLVPSAGHTQRSVQPPSCDGLEEPDHVRNSFGISGTTCGLDASLNWPEPSRLRSQGDEGMFDTVYEDEVLSPRSIPSSTCAPKMEVAKQKGVFATCADMKDFLRDTVGMGQMQQIYKINGVSQRIARSACFEYTTLLVIVAYAIWMGVDTDWNDSDVLSESQPIFFVAEHIFCSYFSIELLIRFVAVARKIDCLHDACFVFDFTLVVTMVVETWVLPLVYLYTAHGNGGTGLVGDASILRIAKLLRLIRVFRVARIVRLIPELNVMVKAIAAGTRTVMFAFILLALVIYVFGLALVQTLRHTAVGSEHFGSILRAVNSLFLFGTFLDGISDIISKIERESILALGIVYTFMIVNATIILNMLVGVLCEIISSVAAAEKDAIQIKWIKDNFTRMIQVETDELGNEFISRTEFLAMLSNNEAMATLRAIDVDIDTFVEFVDVLFESSTEKDLICVWQLADLIVQLRGSNSATVKDIIEVRRMLSAHFKQIQQALGIRTTQKGSLVTRRSRRNRMSSYLDI